MAMVAPLAVELALDGSSGAHSRLDPHESATELWRPGA
jgi:hypothetical protein